MGKKNKVDEMITGLSSWLKSVNYKYIECNFVPKQLYTKNEKINAIIRTIFRLSPFNFRRISDINEVPLTPQSNVALLKAYSIIKDEEILKLFKFDLEKTGVSYLLQAILISTQNAYFNLETLCEEISKNTHIKKEEVERLIVARIKERFGFKKSPAIDFIRLVKSVLTQKEDI